MKRLTLAMLIPLLMAPNCLDNPFPPVDMAPDLYDVLPSASNHGGCAALLRYVAYNVKYSAGPCAGGLTDPACRLASINAFTNDTGNAFAYDIAYLQCLVSHLCAPVYYDNSGVGYLVDADCTEAPGALSSCQADLAMCQAD